MQSLTSILHQDWIYSLVWTLVHSLWQFGLVAIFCALLLSVSKNFSAAFRYILALGSLTLCTFISIITLYEYQKSQSEIVIRSETSGGFIYLFTSNSKFSIDVFINNHVDILIIGWLTGFLLLGLNTLHSYIYCQRLTHQLLIPTPVHWLIRFRTLAQQLGVATKIELRISKIAKVPCVIGHLKPVILLPTAVLLHMSQQQIEAVLLHELAHVRRRDFLVGLLQALLKTLFFFNPFLYWISHQIDKEREYACDDIALAITKDPLLFANTLKEFADMNIRQSNAMPITGKKMLLARITRLFIKQQQSSPLAKSLLISTFVALSALAFSLCVTAETDKLNNKKISIDAADVDVQTLLNEINQRCGTTQKLATGSEEKLTLVLNDISCKDALQLVIDFANGAEPSEALSE